MAHRFQRSRLACWALYIQENDFEIVHRAGRCLTNADALSRITVNVNTSEVIDNHIQQITIMM